MSCNMSHNSKPRLNILNELDETNMPCEDSDETTSQISQNLQRIMLRLKGEFMSDDGRTVDYKSMSSSPLYDQYKSMCSRLHRVNMAHMSTNERMAFAINVYNCLTIHGLVECMRCSDEAITSVLDIRQFWQMTAYNIGAHIYTLDDLEHGILRGNKPHPTSTKLPFECGDERCQYVISPLDPRIHFTLVCAAKSCPSINVYTSDNLERALTQATANFCQNEIRVLPKNKQIYMSKIFQWYRSDFGVDDVAVARWCAGYVNDSVRCELVSLLDEMVNRGGVTIYYTEYDWSLNILPTPHHITRDQPLANTVSSHYT